MSRTATVARLVLGALFVVFGLNVFLQLVPQPPPDPRALPFLGGLAATGYMFPLMGAVEVAVGVALLTNRFVPLALVVLAPLTVNIVLFHAFLSLPGMGLALAVLAGHLVLAWAHRAAFAPLLRARAVGGRAAEETRVLRERVA